MDLTKALAVWIRIATGATLFGFWQHSVLAGFFMYIALLTLDHELG